MNVIVHVKRITVAFAVASYIFLALCMDANIPTLAFNPVTLGLYGKRLLTKLFCLYQVTKYH